MRIVACGVLVVPKQGSGTGSGTLGNVVHNETLKPRNAHFENDEKRNIFDIQRKAAINEHYGHKA